MQRETESSNGNSARAVATPSEPLTSPPADLSDGGDFSGFYSSIFQRTDSLQTQETSPFTPSSCQSEEENEISKEGHLYFAHLALKYEELGNKYGICLSHLQEVVDENELLRQEIARLRIANRDLTKSLNLLSLSVPPADYPPLSLVNEFGNLHIGVGGQNRGIMNDFSETSPTSVFGFQDSRFGGTGVDRASLPKSISVRSSGFLKMSQGNGSGASSSRSNRRRSANPGNVASVYVPGRKMDEEAIEVEVYNQGMFKTELCNKWQETGACPYGDNCQFAHGIEELRPVVRHPRYKTEVCRMVLAGDICPYGHRCHFRHSITDQDRIVIPR